VADRPPSRVLVIEHHSVALVVGALRAVRRADQVWFSRRVPLQPIPVRNRRWAHRLVRLINPRAGVHDVNTDQLLDYLPLNAAGVRVVAGLADAIADTQACRSLVRLTGRAEVVRYFQGALAIRAANWGLLSRVATRLTESVDGKAEVAVVADWDTRQMAGAFGGQQAFTAPLGAWMRAAAATVIARASALAVPILTLVRAGRRGWRRGAPSAYTVAMPVVWGVSNTPGPRPHADDYLYGETLTPGSIVHVFGDYVVSPEDQARYESTMRERGYAFVDSGAYQLDKSTIRAALQTVGAACSLWWPRRASLERLVQREVPKGYHHFLRKTLECANVLSRVELVRNDYNPGHVVATAVARTRGIRTVAVQHNALPFESPQMSFVEVDALAIYGEFYRKGYAPHWDRLPCHATGRESLDWALETLRDPARRADVAARWAAVRPAGRPTALVMFPSERDITIPALWNAMAAGLERVAAEMPEVDVLLRFRTEQSLRAPHVAQLRALADRSGSFLVPPPSFSTYDLMTLAGLAITYDGSFTVNEGIAFGIPTFSFEFIGAGRYYFGQYGQDFVLRSPEDVVRTFLAWRAGRLSELDVDWDGLRRDLNCHTDGGNRARLRQLVERAAS